MTNIIKYSELCVAMLLMMIRINAGGMRKGHTEDRLTVVESCGWTLVECYAANDEFRSRDLALTSTHVEGTKPRLDPTKVLQRLPQ